MLFQRLKAVRIIVTAAMAVAFGVPVTAADSTRCVAARGASSAHAPLFSYARERDTLTYEASERASRPALALKTNLLLDAASFVNLGMEVPIGERVSIAAECYFPWWRIPSRDITLELLAGTLEARYWFGRGGSRSSNGSRHCSNGLSNDGRSNSNSSNGRSAAASAMRAPLTGFFAGVYAGAGYYDFQPGSLTQGRGIQGEMFIMGGLGFGYAHRIGEHLHMEYSLGVGFVRSDFREYEPAKGTKYGDIKVRLYPWEEKRFSGVLPTKASVSLVWTIGGRRGGTDSSKKNNSGR